MGIVASVSKAVAILGLVGLLGWRVLVSGLADYYDGQGTLEAATGALRWRDSQPDALYRQGLALSGSDPIAAESLLQTTVWSNPTDALIFLALADLQTKKNSRAAQTLVEIADVLAPMRSPAIIRSADFWLAQNQIDRVLMRWSTLLRTRPSMAKQLYPVLLGVAEDQRTRSFLQPLLIDPPEWWDQFFAYAAARAVRVETVMFLYQHHSRKDVLPTVSEQRAYLNRLSKEGYWLDMYLAWLNGLDERQKQGLGHLYNGNFELPISNLGFDWHVSSPRGAVVEAIETYGTRGGKALHVEFDGQRVRFRHVFQYLYLEPGSYQFKGRVRLQELRTARGLRWVIRCQASETRPPLAEAGAFVGTDDWQVFVTSFSVPNEGCMAQVLRLVLEGRTALEFEVDGDVWFDDLSIVRQRD